MLGQRRVESGRVRLGQLAAGIGETCAGGGGGGPGGEPIDDLNARREDHDVSYRHCDLCLTAMSPSCSDAVLVLTFEPVNRSR